MDDKQLLELAAKAAGLKFGTKDADRWIGVDWNPLTDDGDALRLAVKLGLDLYLCGEAVVQVVRPPSIYADEPKAADPYAATRRAIVRAAAEIGKAAS